ncbi:putative RNA-directed DNA polymerase [Helianthus annuus]|nr:putative RNA-directed DNA polymerase [Helianthus annuus]
MQAEFTVLQENETWDLVPRPTTQPVIRCMWLFRHKFKSDGTLERYKARLVVNGKSQTVGIDCEDTSSPPVVKPATIRIVLSLAVSRSWPIHQLDVKNAFLHGHLNETVFMHQPPGFLDRRYAGFVCRLKKSIYGLKQASRAWYTRFATYILSQGFRSSVCDNSLFIYTQGPHIAYLLLYVDDIVLTASSEAFLHDVIQKLSREFAMTDLGALHHLLGIKVTRRPNGLFLDQSQYAKEILARASMTNCKPCATPVDLSSKLSAIDGPLFHDPTLYRSLAGALQYLTFTRPDISYAVQQVCLFMHEPREPHYAFMKRILRYLQGMIDYGIRMVKSTTHSLIAYSDADWGGCPDSRRSTSGYCVFLGDNLLSWSSKRQPTVSRSSAEAEYKGVANAVAEATWIRNLLLELQVPLQTASVIYCDNVSAVYLSDNPVQHQRTKRIEIDIHFLREKVRIGHVRVLHVPSSFQYADIFTKGLSRQLFQSFRSSLTVCPLTDQTAGGY